MRVTAERALKQSNIGFLRRRGHEVYKCTFGGIAQAVSCEDGRVYAASDFRKNGGIDGF